MRPPGNPVPARPAASDRLRSDNDVTIHAAWSPGEIRVAAVAKGALVDYALWRPGSPYAVGDVYRGRVTGIVPAMAGAFVALTNGKPGRTDAVDGFLPNSEGAKGLNEGSILTVRITRAAQGGKGPRLSARFTPAEDSSGDKSLGLLRRGIDPVRELAARYAKADVLVDDPALAASLRADLGDRLTRRSEAFDDRIETEVGESRIIAGHSGLGCAALRASVSCFGGDRCRWR